MSLTHFDPLANIRLFEGTLLPACFPSPPTGRGLPLSISTKRRTNWC